MPGGDPLEQYLGALASHLELGGHPEGELDQLGVEQRDPALQRARHGHPVDLHQAVVAQITLEVNIELTVHLRAAGDLTGELQDVGFDGGAHGPVRL